MSHQVRNQRKMLCASLHECWKFSTLRLRWEISKCRRVEWWVLTFCELFLRCLQEALVRQSDTSRPDVSVIPHFRQLEVFQFIFWRSNRHDNKVVCPPTSALEASKALAMTYKLSRTHSYLTWRRAEVFHALEEKAPRMIQRNFVEIFPPRLSWEGSTKYWQRKGSGDEC